jgi:hypothetical protein
MADQQQHHNHNQQSYNPIAHFAHRWPQVDDVAVSLNAVQA